MDSLATATLAELAGAVSARALSPVEIVQGCLDRIARLDGRLHAFLEVFADDALAEARAAEREIVAGNLRGPMHGLPVGLKDMIDVAGRATTANSPSRRDHVAARDAAVVRNLRAAGAVVLGKQALAEFMMAGTQLDLPWAAPVNPWNPALDPSNSSSGSAVAVAAGLCPAAIGSDTGGSIRGPAAWCGIAGLKPTYGLVSRDGTLDYAPSLDHLGPMAWTVEDCAILLDAMVAAGTFRQAQAGSVAGLRVGVPRAFFEGGQGVEPDMLVAFGHALSALADLGLDIREVALSPHAAYASAAAVISMAEGYALHGEAIERAPDLVGATALARMRACGGIPAEQVERARLRQAELTAELDGVLASVDLLALPAARRPAQPLGYDALKGDAFLNRAFNLTGHPALAMCDGFDAAGLPLSLQLVGRRGEDAAVLRVGAALERVVGLRGRRPAIAGG
ncbi:MAG: amidase [Rhizobiales bacterium]|nr:amidase [Hyphomicrobiales bacterium]